MTRPKRVLIAGIYHETNTFVPGVTRLADFACLRGHEMLRVEGDTSPLGGTLEAARACGWEVVTAVDYRATPSGTVEDAVLEAWWTEFQGAAHGALADGPLDGLFLVLHGAMVTANCLDVEGELLARMRALPGLYTLPIAGVTDLHANVSQQMARLSEALITYRRNPHTDARETAQRAVRVLDSLIATGRGAQTRHGRPPLVLTPTATGTDDEPMCTLEAMARQMETAHPEVLAVNVHAGFAFADTPDTGVSFTIVTVGASDVSHVDLGNVEFSNVDVSNVDVGKIDVGKIEVGKIEVGNIEVGIIKAGDIETETVDRLLEELSRTAMETPVGSQCDEVSVDEALTQLAAYDTGPVLLVEPSDNIGAGAPGEGVTLLRALVAHDVRNAGVIVNDPVAVTALAGLAPAERCTLTLGGKSSPLYDGECTLGVELVSRSDGRFNLEDPHSHMASMLGSQIEMGPCAVVRHGGVVILLTSFATAPFDLGQWRSQGISPEQLRVIGVKAAVAHRRAYNPIARDTIYVRTPGPCCTDLRALPFSHIRRPIRPLDEEAIDNSIS